MSDAEKIKAAVHWMDTMKERLDHYEVHRNEFLSDMRLPPRNVKFLREVLLPFCENTLLLDNLAKSEGLCYWKDGQENRLRIIIRVERDGKMHEVITNYPELVGFNSEGLVCYKCNFPYLLKHKDFDKEPKDNTLVVGLNGRVIKAGDSEYDFEICLPHEHTIYSILENVIRNSAKHNASRFKPLEVAQGAGDANGDATVVKVETLNIHLDITDAGADHYHCTIYDNVSRVRLGAAVADADGIVDLTKIIDGKNKHLLVDGRPNRENMGMADMKINAFLLMSAEDFKEEDLNKALDVVICDRCTDGGHEHTVVRQEVANRIKKFAWENGEYTEAGTLDDGTYLFGYRFKLTKAKKVAWIGEAAAGIAQSDEYKRAGIHGYATWSDYITSLSEGLAAYEIAVLEKEVWEGTEEEQMKWEGAVGDKARPNPEPNNTDERSKWLRKRLARLPFRVLVNSSNGVVTAALHGQRVVVGALKCTSHDGLFLDALATWVRGKHRLDGRPIYLRALFIKPEGDPPGGMCKNEIDAVTWYWRNDAPHPALNGTGATIPHVVSDAGRLVILDHHGFIGDAGLVSADPNNSAVLTKAEWTKREMMRWGCLWNAYAYTDKLSRDHDNLVRLLCGKKLDTLSVLDLSDCMLRRVFILDERFGAHMADSNPAEHAKVAPNDMWGYLAASGVYVITRLVTRSVDKGISCESVVDFLPGDQQAIATSLELLIAEDVERACLHFKPKVGEVSETIPEGHGSLGLDLLTGADVLVVHRTYWKAMSEGQRNVLLRNFGEVVLTSGAGRPEGFPDLKYISFAVLESLTSRPRVSKLALTRTLGGLTVPPTQ